VGAATARYHSLRPDILRSEITVRWIVEQIALALSASLLIRHAPHDIADAFIASRLAGPWSGPFRNIAAGHKPAGDCASRRAAADVKNRFYGCLGRFTSPM
jgi:hypothetical protein